MNQIVSVIVRSFNRVPSLCDLLEALLRQTWPHLEIVVVEQSTHVPGDAAERLAALARDPRIILLRRPPLGGAAARNVGVDRSRGQILLFIDDDDLPTDENWVAQHVQALADPNCLGVSGRHIYNDGPNRRPLRWLAALTGTLSYDPFLKLSVTYVQHDQATAPVKALHGTNASLRRSARLRFGGWDEDTAIEDEVSFCFRALRMKQAHEYFAYDPRPTIIRNRDIQGGLDKRRMNVGRFFRHYLDYVHRIIGRYHPWRVLFLYPLYIVASYCVAVITMWKDSRRYRTWASRLWAPLILLIGLPIHLGSAWFRLIQTPERMRRVFDAQLPAVSATDDPSGVTST